MRKSFGLHFGIMSESIAIQIQTQGFVMDTEVAKPQYWTTMQRNKDAVTGLHIVGVITDSEYDKICQRFIKELAKYVVSPPVVQETPKPENDTPYCNQCGNDNGKELACIGNWASGTEYRCKVCQHTFQFRHPKES